MATQKVDVTIVPMLKLTLSVPTKGNKSKVLHSRYR